MSEEYALGNYDCARSLYKASFFLSDAELRRLICTQYEVAVATLIETENEVRDGTWSSNA